jgi:hypothetical protein
MHKTIATVVLSVIAAVLWGDVSSPTLSAAQLSVAQRDTDGPQPVCPDPDNPKVNYISSDPSACARIRFTCAPGEVLFSNSCGCGCIAPNSKGGLPLQRSPNPFSKPTAIQPR